ncbi:predicted protein [Phaeodactylum tricornutum CCAP 1055/1]|jgi:uncharacterized protein YbjT (DUF2867 family)|uniref:NmrA-like domain-containing protein n=2 Tax=Phaeodactylum tricornutum TaxID=2850 RepID=B5Y3K6_PHATC|nr:predicted protein [Phaeodactylum tricornutum CCAP 1055/1]ACI65145.1 predicted protein [Phaeodactylum tricornutum CCAP 1055/1]|eukprot:XP_002185675.1 predicted protein [Phaeodactylum tricornutum CCAP 1055/1]
MEDLSTASPILVASATATTGTATVKALSDMGASVRAMVRKVDDPRAVELAKLPGVSLIEADFDDHDSVKAMLKGIQRALLVTGAFAYEQFEREAFFIEAAHAEGVECVVRISTGSFLIKPGTKGAYGRTHHGLQAFCDVGGYPVVHLNPNWFFTNWMGSAAEARTTGTITQPVKGDGPPMAMIDPRDIGTAAATILTQTTEGLQPFLTKKYIEIHGPAMVNFADKAAALSKALGYPITINTVPREGFLQALMGMGLPRVFANSFLETIEQVDGVVPPGYEGYGPDLGRDAWPVESSPELLAVWKPQYDVNAWAASDAVQAAFKRT